MRASFPRLGSATLAFKTLLESLGREVVPPPPPSKRTLTLGTRYSPECVCFPFKVNVGNYLEALEKGADTIVMLGGCGPCRFGYYAEIQRLILQDLGYQFDMIVLESPQISWWKFLEGIRKLVQGNSVKEIRRAIQTTWAKILAIDEVEEMVRQIRPRELTKGTTTRAYRRALGLIDGAKDLEAIETAQKAALQEIGRVPTRPRNDVLRVGLVGEFYTVLEPFANQDIERLLGEMGVEVVRFLTVSEWVRNNLARSSESKKRREEIHRAAYPYIRNFVGGHGQESVGETVLHARSGCDGVIHLLPFACMPEITARSVLSRVSRDLALPILSLSLDEQTGKAGIITRLEAFVDLLARRRRVDSLVLRPARADLDSSI